MAEEQPPLVQGFPDLGKGLGHRRHYADEYPKIMEPFPMIEKVDSLTLEELFAHFKALVQRIRPECLNIPEGGLTFAVNLFGDGCRNTLESVLGASDDPHKVMASMYWRWRVNYIAAFFEQVLSLLEAMSTKIKARTESDVQARPILVRGEVSENEILDRDNNCVMCHPSPYPSSTCEEFQAFQNYWKRIVTCGRELIVYQRGALTYKLYINECDRFQSMNKLVTQNPQNDVLADEVFGRYVHILTDYFKGMQTHVERMQAIYVNYLKLTVCLSQHARLGNKSGLRQLSIDDIRSILRYV
jgi:hypothetical protein